MQSIIGLSCFTCLAHVAFCNSRLWFGAFSTAISLTLEVLLTPFILVLVCNQIQCKDRFRKIKCISSLKETADILIKFTNF